ncbi:MAG: alpha/beta fold hydrolase [Armatimonadota bacterium]
MPAFFSDGFKLDYTDKGHGVAIVFVPGLCGSPQWFCYQTAGLSTHFRTISTILRPARKKKYSLNLLADDVANLLHHLRVPAAVIAGHGLGALVAVQFAISHLDRCLALVLSSTCPSYNSVSEEQILTDMFIGQSTRQGLWTRIVKIILGNRTTLDIASQLDFLARTNGNPDNYTLQARVKLMREVDLTGKLPQIQVPALVVAGSNEPDYILNGCQRVYACLPNASIEIIEYGDHYHFYTRHDQFNAILKEFVTRNVPPP